MLPILQAPADENNTVTTVINHFMSISEKLGQPFTIITADQPLYSRGKELIWANYEKYKNVVLFMGHLHILFNFLKAVGQHMKNVGLVDVWIESGLSACNSTDQMMEGKSYYRAVRGHTGIQSIKPYLLELFCEVGGYTRALKDARAENKNWWGFSRSLVIVT